MLLKQQIYKTTKPRCHKEIARCRRIIQLKVIQGHQSCTCQSAYLDGDDFSEPDRSVDQCHWSFWRLNTNITTVQV